MSAPIMQDTVHEPFLAESSAQPSIARPDQSGDFKDTREQCIYRRIRRKHTSVHRPAQTTPTSVKHTFIHIDGDQSDDSAKSFDSCPGRPISTNVTSPAMERAHIEGDHDSEADVQSQRLPLRAKCRALEDIVTYAQGLMMDEKLKQGTIAVVARVDTENDGVWLQWNPRKGQDRKALVLSSDFHRFDVVGDAPMRKLSDSDLEKEKNKKAARTKKQQEKKKEMRGLRRTHPIASPTD